jgi:glycosyltransferase involved in cell wall biosynthesis
MLSTRTGVGYVTAGLVQALAPDPSIELVAFAVTWRGRSRLSSIVPAGVLTRPRPFPARLARVLWPRTPHPRAEYWTGEVDVVHAPNFVAPPARAPVLVTVHDLAFAHSPELCTRDARTYMRLLEVAIGRGATIHTYSKYVAAEVRAHFDLPNERIFQIYPGLTPTTGHDPVRGRHLARHDRYIVALGTIEPRKNLPALVEAFDRVAKVDREVALVIAGPDGWGVDAFVAACEASRHHDRIVRLGYVDERDRRDLLAGASVLAYPSLYEGFGLPPLEAMQVGTPVVASNAGALGEVLGDAALLHDPRDVDALAAALQEVLAAGPLRDRLLRAGTERVRRYSWRECADSLPRLYRTLACSDGHH